MGGSREAAALFLLVSSGLAFWVVFHEKGPSWLTAILLTPQVLVILLAAISSGQAIWLSHYADGVIRPRGFIAADQVHPLILLAFHQWAFLTWHRGAMKWGDYRGSIKWGS